MRTIILYTFLFLNFNSFSQNENITKIEVENFLQSTLDNSKAWFACNIDSAYYKTDTITFCSSILHLYQKNCCHHIEWYFSNATKFKLSKTNICHKPIISTIESENSSFKIKTEHINNGVIIKIKTGGESIRFKVISINQKELWKNGNNAHFIKMIRLK